MLICLILIKITTTTTDGKARYQSPAISAMQCPASRDPTSDWHSPAGNGRLVATYRVYLARFTSNVSD